MNSYDRFLFDVHRNSFQEKIHENDIFDTFPDKVDQRRVIGKARLHGVRIIRKRRVRDERAERAYFDRRELEREMKRF